MKLEELTDVIVGGLQIEVNSPNHDLINNGLLGHYLPACLEIGIRDDLPLQLQGNVLVHEVTHAIANVYCEGLGLDESQVSGIAQGFHQVLVDNEDLVEFITQSSHIHDGGEVHPDLDGIMNGHVMDRGDKIVRTLAHKEAGVNLIEQEYDKIGVDQGGH
jgi:hypothetical protein